ncbi:DUF4340 domain-containing protein [Alkalispirochaeta alkalica]|uniref:DUF4340 domain-containing protein n=1 Tax=Alkalispirochaeta alkalica TaxID=46356 RepID=UPI00036692B7|nr:DUF4340 domain-containing protein [Alkalispirochaeta alkalica]
MKPDTGFSATARRAVDALGKRFPGVPRSTGIYGAILLVLLAVLAVQQLEREAPNTMEAPDLFSGISRITLEARGRTLTLEYDRQGDRWLVGPQGFRGDAPVVEELIQAVADLSRLEVVSTRGRFEAYGLTGDTRRRVTFEDDRGGEFTLDLGDSARAGAAVYGRLNTGREVVRLPRALHNRVSADPDDFRDLLVARLPREELEAVRIEAPGVEPVTMRPDRDVSEEFSGDDPGWRASREVAPGRIRDFFQEVGAVRASSFLTTEEAQELAGEEAFAGVFFTSADGGETLLEFFPPRGDSSGGRLVPARITGEEYPFFLPEWRVRRILLGLEEYLRPFTESPGMESPVGEDLQGDLPGVDGFDPAG